MNILYLSNFGKTLGISKSFRIQFWNFLFQIRKCKQINFLEKFDKIYYFKRCFEPEFNNYINDLCL